MLSEQPRPLSSIITQKVVSICVKIMQQHDSTTYRHAMNVREIALRVSRQLGIDSTRSYIIEAGSLLHDFGKLMLPEDLLRKNGYYTIKEHQLVRNHTVMGYAVLSSLARHLPQEVLDIILLHHEKNGGVGYPTQCKLLPLHVQIVAIADIAAGMQEDRYYRSGYDLDMAIYELRQYKWHEAIEGLIESSPEIFKLDKAAKKITKSEVQSFDVSHQV